MLVLENRFLAFAARDTVLVILALVAWLLAARLALSGPVLGWIAGLAVALAVYIAHEWGHALAALAAGGRIHPPRTLWHVSLFSFDTERNSVRHFAWMSLGGFAVTAIAVLVAQAWLHPDELSHRVARGGIFTLAGITLFIEVPLLVFGLATKQIPSVVAVFRYESSGH
jgi:hypothetical protein